MHKYIYSMRVLNTLWEWFSSLFVLVYCVLIIVILLLLLLLLLLHYYSILIEKNPSQIWPEKVVFVSLYIYINRCSLWRRTLDTFPIIITNTTLDCTTDAEAIEQILQCSVINFDACTVELKGWRCTHTHTHTHSVNWILHNWLIKFPDVLLEISTNKR